jgi:phage-related holin
MDLERGTHAVKRLSSVCVVIVAAVLDRLLSSQCRNIVASLCMKFRGTVPF